ncbi:universal stress protein, partial [Pseudonocardia lacus]|uniref:universal stress protein n=1 Tax=Pseudonocardia lacus TaxID=2835865 RepID=UPI001BDD0B30
ALAAVRAAVPGLAASARPGSGATADLLRTRSVDAGLLVVPADLPDLDRVVAEAYCPVAAVPRRPVPPGGSVVVGVAPWTTDDTVALAFAEAAARRVRLVAVRAWDRPGVDLGWLRPERIAQWDQESERARREVEWALSAQRIVHPDVPVEVVVAQDSATELLLALATRARLLVLGRSCRGALLAGLVGSPVDDLLRTVRCPVVVVPAEGGPRGSWWPSRDHGWVIDAHL